MHDKKANYRGGPGIDWLCWSLRTLRTLPKHRGEHREEAGEAERRLMGPMASLENTLLPNRLWSRLREKVLGLWPPILGLGLEAQRLLLKRLLLLLSGQLPGHPVFRSPSATLVLLP